jgi:glycosyltransferase involved in cell wall biosynthesis
VIVHILANDSPGGTQSRTLGHVRALAAQGLDQTVVVCSTRSASSALRDELVAAQAEVLYLPLDGGVAHFSVRLFRLLRKVRATAVLSHGFGFHAVVAILAKLARVGRVVVLVGNPIAKDHGELVALRRRSRIAVRSVDWVVACSDHVAESLIENVGVDAKTIRTMANPLDVESIRTRAELSRRRRESDARAVLCKVARLDEIKDHETVLRSVAMLRERGRDVRLLLVGTGPTESRLRLRVEALRIADHVEFLGDRRDTPEILGSADLFVFGMTWNEGFGIALAEAMAAGTPIVCTDAGPAAEVLAGGRAGLLVSPGDSVAMADAIERLLDNELVRAELADEARAVATLRHDVGRLRRELQEVLGL